MILKCKITYLEIRLGIAPYYVGLQILKGLNAWEEMTAQWLFVSLDFMQNNDSIIYLYFMQPAW
jgi:hypothetical protein